jgi:hypothetical protein
MRHIGAVRWSVTPTSLLPPLLEGKTSGLGAVWKAVPMDHMVECPRTLLSVGLLSRFGTF